MTIFVDSEKKKSWTDKLKYNNIANFQWSYKKEIWYREMMENHVTLLNINICLHSMTDVLWKTSILSWIAVGKNKNITLRTGGRTEKQSELNCSFATKIIYYIIYIWIIFIKTELSRCFNLLTLGAYLTLNKYKVHLT